MSSLACNPSGQLVAMTRGVTLDGIVDIFYIIIVKFDGPLMNCLFIDNILPPPSICECHTWLPVIHGKVNNTIVATLTINTIW